MVLTITWTVQDGSDYNLDYSGSDYNLDSHSFFSEEEDE